MVIRAIQSDMTILTVSNMYISHLGRVAFVASPSPAQRHEFHSFTKGFGRSCIAQLLPTPVQMIADQPFLL